MICFQLSFFIFNYPTNCRYLCFIFLIFLKKKQKNKKINSLVNPAKKKKKNVFGQSHDIEHDDDYFINFVALLASSCKIRVFN